MQKKTFLLFGYIGRWMSMLDPNVASLVLPYVKKERQWVMLAARTSKALSHFLDMVQHHWESRFRTLLTKLRSGRARFEIERYVHCCMSDSFYWSDRDNLNGFAFTVSVLEDVPRSFARQAVPQLMRIMDIMNDWNAGGDASISFTARRRLPNRNLFPSSGCRKTFYIGAIPIRTATTPSALVSGDLDVLADWMDSRDREGGYDTDESWECECGESYSTSGW
jgi:hypothetical protein